MNTSSPSVGRRRSLADRFALPAILLILALPLSAAAQGFSSYNVQHSFAFTPGWWPIWNQGPGWTPQVWFMPGANARTWAYAFADGPGVPPQSSFDNDSAWLIPGTAIQSHAHAVSGNSAGDAWGTASLGTFGPWGTTLGTVTASGWASAGRGGIAYATSAANFSLLPTPGLFYQYAWWSWQPWFQIGVGGSAAVWQTIHDPIAFTISDPATGDLLESGSFLEIDVDGDGNGAADWSAGNLTLTPPTDPTDTLTLHVLLSDPTGNNYIRPEDAGELRITYTGDTITDILALGQFADWDLPSIGFEGPLSMATQDIEFGVDFHRPVNAGFTAGNSGAALVVPEAGTYGAWGALVLFGTALYRRSRSRR